MSENDIFKIRPAGRHILTIGEDLIQDQYAAIIELVKNAYDADSPDITICFKRNVDKNYFEIRIEDHGHGMSKDDIVNKWLVPSTSYKINKRYSPKGRLMQGRKGIGRYSASILGSDLLLETVDEKGEKTELYIEWNQFRNSDFLDQVDILVTSEHVSEYSGTILTIHDNLEKIIYWDNSSFDNLRRELKKLIPPKTDYILDDKFEIKLSFENFFDDLESNVVEVIEPYPILELFDYRISGNISANGIGKLIYESRKLSNTIKEEINVDYEATKCGNLSIDIRVYDREKDAIDLLISRGLRDSITGNYVSNLEARQLINNINGIGVYRNGFRIRPLGNADFDWLKLNEERVQKPSLRIGSNQVVGYVHIESEEKSNLEEKSARDGLKNNYAYKRLIDITKNVIKELENKRFILRRKLDILKPNKKVENELEELYDFSSLKKSVSISLKNAGLLEDNIIEIIDIISKDQLQKNKIVDNIKQAVAIYQGQATLGKIINVVLHEGREPLNYFKNQISVLKYYAEEFNKTPDEECISEIIKITSGVANNANIFVELFKRLDPLAARKRSDKSEFFILETLNEIKSIFNGKLFDKRINLSINGLKELKFLGWSQDFYSIFSNLIDNSIFWIEEKKCVVRNINIDVSYIKGILEINYTDSGPGISPKLINEGVIFEPQFTTKSEGTGIGLSIAGEAATRNGLLLKALQCENGAYFTLVTDSEVIENV